jgi:preprotein translocase subunit SecB
LQSDHDGVEVENRLPIFSKDVQAYVALKVDIWMINLDCSKYSFSLTEVSASTPYFLCTLHLWGIMRIVGVDSEGEFESATLVHACRGKSEPVENHRI